MVIEFDIPQSGYRIRPAEPADAKALRMLLPGMNATAGDLVAVDGRHDLVIGAAMATRVYRHKPMIGPGIALHVIEPCRRLGIGRSLAAALAAAARSGGAMALYSAKRAELDSDEMRGWQWLGFTPCETVERHRLPLRQLESQLAPLVERMRQRGRIPVAAQIIPLYRADLPAVLRLHLDNMGGDSDDLDRRMRGHGRDAFLPQHSRVLIVDNGVKGCILGHRRDANTIVVDANIVDPALRGGWANAWLKLETTRGALRAGAREIEFTTFDHYTDTRSLAMKLGGVTTSTSVLMYRPVGD